MEVHCVDAHCDPTLPVQALSNRPLLFTSHHNGHVALLQATIQSCKGTC